MEAKSVRITVMEFDREKEAFVPSEHVVKITSHTTVLDSLIYIKETIDPKISFRYSCRMGICGSCAMVINGKPRLACETMIAREGFDELEVGPIKGQPILKSLTSDFDDFFEKHRDVMPWLFRKKDSERFDDKKEYSQTESERNEYLPFAECIKCGLCLDACPVVNTNREFLGPQALAQAYRYNKDSRDQGEEMRLDYLDTLKGVWGCEFAGACSKVCPKHVDPALAIQALKADIAKRHLSKMTEKK